MYMVNVGKILYSKNIPRVDEKTYSEDNLFRRIFLRDITETENLSWIFINLYLLNRAQSIKIIRENDILLTSWLKCMYDWKGNKSNHY